MTRAKWLFSILVIVLTASGIHAQKIIYSEPDRDDIRHMNFEVAGKVGGNFLIYKNIHNRDWICVLDNDMKEIAREEQDYIPENNRVINVDFFPYSDFCYMIYQYQKKNVVYCAASKLDANGKKVGDVIELDTTHIGFSSTSNHIYTVITNESKNNILILKINSKNRRQYVATTILLNEKLEMLKRSSFSIAMDEHYESLTEFHLDNDGDLVFCKFYRSAQDDINKAFFMLKYAQADSLLSRELNIEKNNLDEIHIKTDNFNRRYLLTSFCYKEHRGNIDGYYFYVWDKATASSTLENTVAFSDELRKEAKGESYIKAAFNDYFIRNIIVRRDGGFIIASESYYTTSRFNNWSRTDYLYGPQFGAPLDYYNYSPYSSGWSYFRNNNFQPTRYHADNIAVIAFDKEGKMQWNTVVGKEQYDDESDDLLSYQLMNTGGQLHFLFNQEERRNNLLNDYSITPDGQLNHNPTLKNLDGGYQFMPKYGKQVSARQTIVPCQYHNSVCFAKIEYN